MTNMNQNGRSMIEMLGVLAIIGVLSVGGIAGYSKAMLKFKTNKTLDEIAMIVTNIRTMYAQQNTFTGLNNLVACNMGVVPDEMIKSTPGSNGLYSGSCSIQNPFNGAVNIKVHNSTSQADGTNRAFIVSFNSLPKQACLEMAVNDWGSNYSSGLIGMAIAKTSDNGETTTAADVRFSADVTGAYTDTCTGGAKNAVAATISNGQVTGGSAASQLVCAANMPLNVATAASACDCEDSNSCSISFKYY